MTEATLTRAGETVTLPLLDEGAGSPVVARDVGKPEAGPEKELGRLDPTWRDTWSQLETFSLLGRYTGADAYADAIALADLVKSHSGGEGIDLSIDLPETSDSMLVAPAPEQERALELTYASGWTDVVGVELTLTRVDSARGGSGPTASTPTATGDGPITLSDGTDTVAFTAGVEVTRTVGRSNTELRRSTGERPIYIDASEAAYDEIDLTVEFVVDAADRAEALIDMVGQPLGTASLTLDFGGVFGMGSMDVAPTGSGALRAVRPSAERAVVVPGIALRRVST